MEAIDSGSGCQPTVKEAVMLWGVFAIVMIAQTAEGKMPEMSASAAEYTGRWIGPVLASAASLAATIFAYLTARDSKKFDANRLLLEHRLEQAEKDVIICKQDRERLQSEIEEMRDEQDTRYRQLWDEMHGGAAAPAPNQSQATPPNDRRRGTPPDYKGPFRRADDPKKGSRTHRSLPKKPKTDPPKPPQLPEGTEGT